MSLPESLKRIFNDVLERPFAERSTYLDRVCGSDAALRAQAEELLALHDGAPRFLAAPTVQQASGSAVTAATEARIHITAGSRIDGYKLLQPIGEGGFGTVFLAEQESPVRRRVAFKIIKPGMDSRQVIARFEAERQALAMMDHPHIARVFDAGATEAGHPYFVMELVRGEPITEHCDRNHLGIFERLELFALVCRAVQHAHQKGVIHRDIKPSNVLVTNADGKATPKVIDFGIAKATSGRLTEKTLFTEHRQLIGTPEYMSPEQAEMMAGDVDTRSDIYSLGVLLYELLTGTLPFDSKRLRSAAFAEIQRIIREEDPPTPSIRLSRFDELASIAARRRVEPSGLTRLLRGDLDWIVMKCLEKDRARRYETAASLAEDIQRHQRGEPVQAAPPGRLYRARKFVRRHRTGVFTTVLVGMVLVGGVVGTTIGMLRANAAERDQFRLREAAQASERQAHHAAEHARRQRDRARAAAGFMRQMLQGLEPSVSLGRDTTIMKELLDRAAAQIAAGALAEAPEAELLLRQTIGHTYRLISAFDEADRILAPALDLVETLSEDAVDTLDLSNTLNALGLLAADRGRAAEAEALLRRAHELNVRLLGEEHAESELSLGNLAYALHITGRSSEAEPLFRRVLEMRRRRIGTDHPDIAINLGNLAVCLEALGRWSEALPLHRESVAMRQRIFHGDRPETVTALNNLATCLETLGEWEESLAISDAVLRMQRRLHADDNPQIAATLNNIATCLIAMGRHGEALPRLEESLGMFQRFFEGDHPSVAVTLANIGACLRELNRMAEALPYFEAALAMQRRLYDGDHQAVALGLGNLGHCLASLERYDEALEHYEAAQAMNERLYSGDHPHIAWMFDSSATCLVRMGRGAEALSKLQAALAMRQRLFPENHPEVAGSLNNMAACLENLERPAEAEPIYQRAAAMFHRLAAGDHPSVVTCLRNLARVRQKIGRFDEAEEALRQSLDMARRLSARVSAAAPDTSGNEVPDPVVAASLGMLATLLLEKGGAEHAREAESAARECLEMRESLYPDGSPLAWFRFVTMTLVGETLVARVEQDMLTPEAKIELLREAESLVLAGAARILEDPDVPPPGPATFGVDHRKNSIRRAVRLFETWCTIEPTAVLETRAAEWRDRLSAFE